MPTIDEIDKSEREYALALGRMAMQAGNVEFWLRELLCVFLDECDPPTADRIRIRGKEQVSKVIEMTRSEAKHHLTDVELLDSIRRGLDRCKKQLETRNDLLHSSWEQTVFDESPNPKRTSARGRQQHRTELQEIQVLALLLEGSWGDLRILATEVSMSM